MAEKGRKEHKKKMFPRCSLSPPVSRFAADYHAQFLHLSFVSFFSAAPEPAWVELQDRPTSRRPARTKAKKRPPRSRTDLQ
jgi:hypothetical protein